MRKILPAPLLIRHTLSIKTYPSKPIHHDLSITTYPSRPIHHNLCIIINRRQFRSWEIQLRRLALTSPFERRLLARGSARQGLR